MDICQNRPKSKSNIIQIIESKSNVFGIDPALLVIFTRPCFEASAIVGCFKSNNFTKGSKIKKSLVSHDIMMFGKINSAMKMIKVFILAWIMHSTNRERYY